MFYFRFASLSSTSDNAQTNVPPHGYVRLISYPARPTKLQVIYISCITPLISKQKL